MAGLVESLCSRQLGWFSQGRNGDARRWASKLELSETLAAHEGCVNRLHWSSDGSMLASASDDCQVVLWHWPDTQRVPLALQTQHSANLFGVAFLPESGNARVVSGGMDCTVQLHELEAGAFNIQPRFRSSSSSSSSCAGAAGVMRRHPPPPQTHTVMPRTTVFQCHKNRVKEVEVSPGDPSLFWSAGEDAIVRQYDTRLPSRSQNAFASPNVLVELTSAGPRGSLVECKGMCINKLNPHLVAVACGDPYVRVFDRRMTTPGHLRDATTPSVLQLAPPHLPMGVACGMVRRCHATHCSFSNRGDRLVGSFHGDHAYIFDVTSAGRVSTALTPWQQLQQQLQQQQRQQRRQRRRRAHEGSDALDAGACGLPWRQQQQQQQQQNQQQNQQQQQNLQRVPQLPLPLQDCRRLQQQHHHHNHQRLPEAAEAAKVQGNNALFEKAHAAAVQHFGDAIAAAPWAAGPYSQRALALLKRGWEGDACYALLDCEAALLLLLPRADEQQAGSSPDGGGSGGGDGSGSNSSIHRHASSNGSADGAPPASPPLRGQSVQQQARLRLVHALKQLGQVKCALAALASYQARYPAASEELDSLQQLLQQHHEQRRAYRAKVRQRLQQQRARSSVPLQQQQQQQHAAAASGPPGPGIRVDSDLDSDEAEGAAGAGAHAGTAAAAASLDDAEGAAARGPPGAARFLTAAAGGGGSDAAASSSDDEMASSDADECACVPDDEDEDAGSEDELLLPWYGAAAFAREAAPAAPRLDTPGAAAALAAAAAVAASQHHHQQQQQQAGGSSRRRRPRSSDGSEGQAVGSAHAAQSMDVVVGGALPATAAAAAPGSRLRRRRGAAGSGAAEGAPEQQQQQQQQQQHEARSGPAPASAAASTDAGRAPARVGAAGISSSSDAGAHAHDDLPPSPAQHHWWDALSGGAGRVLGRCVGHSNVQTDIKEVCFIGQDDALVAAGSDDGYVFIYDAASGAVVRALPADEDVANCVRGHPNAPVLATSGIDTVVRLWAPTGRPDTRSCEGLVAANQARMADGPRHLRGGLVPPHLLQAALGENPQLLQLLLSQLYGPARDATGDARQRRGGGAAAAAAAAPGPAAGAGVGLGDDDGAGDDDDGDTSSDEGRSSGDDDDDDDDDDDAQQGGEGAEPAGQQQQQHARRRRRRRHAAQQEVACRVA